MIANLFNKNMLKVLVYFLISPGSRHTRKEIKEKIKMNNVPLDETLNLLKSMRLLNIEKSGYYLNFENEKSKEVLNLIKSEYDYFNLPYKIFNIVFKISSELLKYRQIDSVKLFGSYSKLIYNIESDIDIAIIFKDNTLELDKLKERIEKKIKKIEKESKKIIETHFFSKKDLKENDTLIKEIIKNGKSLLNIY
ncbi:MAG: nucleotidyltransferase domain-containing protein [Nanoarchaeota archaeon]